VTGQIGNVTKKDGQPEAAGSTCCRGFHRRDAADNSQKVVPDMAHYGIRITISWSGP